VSWSDGAQLFSNLEAEPTGADPLLAPEVLEVLRSGEPTVIMVGGDATRRAGLAAATRIAAATGARVLCETFPARLERGAGVPAVDRLAYFAEAATAQLDGAKHLVLAGAKSPVSFFAYPGMPSDLVPAGCEVHVLAEYSGAADALIALADEVAPGTEVPLVAESRPQLPTGALTSASAADVIGALLPEGAIVVDESNTSGVLLAGATAGAPAHDWLTLTGGAIGYGIPAAIGAAVAAPHRPVLCLESDGSAMYTISGLWTQARENLDVTTVLYNNSAYDILRIELQRVGVGSSPGPEALSLLDLSDPRMDFVKISEGMGVPARRVVTAEELADALRAAFAEPGPHLIDAVVPSITG
jgi:acetolactate synthase I/II/III large subunit